jgi:hypothetical protein
MNASYPSFQSENANRSFPFVFNHPSSGIKNSWALNLKGFTRRSVMQNINLYKIFVYPDSQSQLSGVFLNDENIDYQNNNFIEKGYLSLLFEVHRGSTILERTVALKIPLSNNVWPYTATTSKIENGVKIYELRGLFSEDIFLDNNLSSFLSINSTLYLEPSLISSIGNVVVDKLSIINPEVNQLTGNIIVSSSDSRVAGRYVRSGTFNGLPEFVGPRDFCIRWKTLNSSRWSISKKTTEVGDFYFSTQSLNSPLSVSVWSRGTSGIQGASISLSEESVTPQRNINGDVLFSAGINTEVLQTSDDIIIRSEVGYGLGESIYSGKDSGVCQGIININGTRPSKSRTFVLRGGEGIIIEDQPESHSIVVKLDPVHKVAKCPPYLKVTDASLFVDRDDPNDLKYYALFNVVLSSKWTTPIQIDYQTVGDTAISNTHFEEKSGSLILGATQKSAEILIPILFENFPAQQQLVFYLNVSTNSSEVNITNNVGEARFTKPSVPSNIV